MDSLELLILQSPRPAKCYRYTQKIQNHLCNEQFQRFLISYALQASRTSWRKKEQRHLPTILKNKWHAPIFIKGDILKSPVHLCIDINICRQNTVCLKFHTYYRLLQWTISQDPPNCLTKFETCEDEKKCRLWSRCQLTHYLMSSIYIEVR